MYIRVSVSLDLAFRRAKCEIASLPPSSMDGQSGPRTIYSDASVRLVPLLRLAKRTSDPSYQPSAHAGSSSCKI